MTTLNANDSMIDTDQIAYLSAMLDRMNDRLSIPASVGSEHFESTTDVLASIKEAGQNNIRCVLTGAPYATMTDSGILSFLNAARAENPAITADSLQDAWDLTLFSMCSRVGPALHNRKRFTLVSLLDGTATGYASLITFYLTRFFFSYDPLNRGMSSARSVARMHFAADWFDTLVVLPMAQLTTLAYRCATSDDWLPLGEWKKLGLFGPRSTKNGIMAPKHLHLRMWTLVPESFEGNPVSLQEALDSMLDIMVHSEANEPQIKVSALASESRLVADEVAIAIENEMKEQPAAVDSMSVAYAEYLEFLTAVGTKVSAYVPHSRTHGPGFLPGAPGPVRKVKKESASKAPREFKLGGRGRQSAKGAAATDAMFAAFNLMAHAGFEV